MKSLFIYMCIVANPINSYNVSYTCKTNLCVSTNLSNDSLIYPNFKFTLQAENKKLVINASPIKTETSVDMPNYKCNILEWQMADRVLSECVPQLISIKLPTFICGGALKLTRCNIYTNTT